MLRPFYIALWLILATLAPSIAAAGDRGEILDQKQELEQLKKDVNRSQKKLDSLKNLQVTIQKQVADYDQKLASNQKVIGRLSRQLDQLKLDVTQAESLLGDHQQQFDRIQRRYLGSVRQTYFAVRRTDNDFFAYPNLELETNRRVVYLTALASFESGNVAEASQHLTESAGLLDELTGKRKQVSSLKKKKEVSYSLEKSQKSLQEKQLSQVRRKSLDEAERMMTLKMAAEEMERIIARLEEQREQGQLAQQQQYETSAFATLKGQLRPPFRGKVVQPYGDIVDPVTKLKSFSPGITIKGQPGRSVYSVASGTVAYSASLRGYGNFVIINHDNQYYTTYAGLGQVLVTTGQHLPGGTKLAPAGEDGMVKFELRKGREPLDPVTWIKFESL